jgi:Fas-binding factor 1
VEDLHHLVEVSHKSSQQERDITMKTKNEYLSQLQDRLLKQQAENDEERTRLQNLVAKMEVQIREHSRKLEEDKWKLNQVGDKH